MLQRTPLFRAFLPQVLGSGLQPDLHLLQKLLWEDAENVSFINGRIKKRADDTLLFNAGTDPIRGISQLLDTNGVRWVYAASGGEVVRWYGPPKETVITGAAWTEDDGLLYPASFWDMIPFGNWTLLNNGQGQPKVFKPEVPSIAVMGDVPSDVVKIMKKQSFVLALGYGAAKTRVGWSDSDDIEEWTAADTNLAGSLTIEEFNTPIRAAEPLGEAIALYAEDQMATLNYVGSPFYFGYKLRLDGIGAVGKMAVAGDGRSNVGVGRNGIWWTDGLSYRYIDEGYMHDYLQDNVNWDQAGKIIAARNDVTGCFDFSFCMGESIVNNEGWSFDPRAPGWYKIPAFSSKAERKLFRKPLLGSLTGDISLELDGATAFDLTLKTRPLLAQLQDETGLVDVHNNVNVQEIDILAKAATDVQWRIGAAQEPTDAFSYCPWQDLVVGAVTYKMPKGVPSGVYHKLEFKNTSASWDLDLQGFALFGLMEGTKRRAASQS